MEGSVLANLERARQGQRDLCAGIGFRQRTAGSLHGIVNGKGRTINKVSIDGCGEDAEKTRPRLKFIAAIGIHDNLAGAGHTNFLPDRFNLQFTLNGLETAQLVFHDNR